MVKFFKMFKCKSKCSFGDDEIENLKKIDLSVYKLTKDDYYNLYKITRRKTIDNGDKGLYRNSILDISKE